MSPQSCIMRWTSAPFSTLWKIVYIINYTTNLLKSSSPGEERNTPQDAMACPEREEEQGRRKKEEIQRRPIATFCGQETQRTCKIFWYLEERGYHVTFFCTRRSWEGIATGEMATSYDWQVRPAGHSLLPRTPRVGTLGTRKERQTRSTMLSPTPICTQECAEDHPACLSAIREKLVVFAHHLMMPIQRPIMLISRATSAERVSY